MSLGVRLSRCVCVHRISPGGKGDALYPVLSSYYYYRRCCLVSGEGIVTLAVTLCVCPPSHLYYILTARHISLGGEGNALYPVLSSSCCNLVELFYRFGQRFPDMLDAYDRNLRLVAWRVGRRLGFHSFLHEGISVIVGGPSFETPAELRMMRMLGADVVGQST